MKTFSIIVLLLLGGVASAQVIKGRYVVMGNTDSVQSKILHENRKIWVYTPAGANDPTYTKQRYPVVYLLDGDSHFASVTGMIQQLSEVNGNMVCPDMIVVAIANTDRTRDLTPTNSMFDNQHKKTDQFKSSGGGEKFTSFIEKELMPHIDSIYPTAPYKILIGHSFGALTAMNIFINHTNLFNAYVVIDPSMWWDGRKLLKQAQDAIKERNFSGKSLFLGIANTMPVGMDTLQVHKDTTGDTEHIRSILALADAFKSNPNNGLNFKYKYYSEDNHGMVTMIAEYDALHFLFGYYRFNQDDYKKVFDPQDKADVLNIIVKHYASLSNTWAMSSYPLKGKLMNWPTIIYKVIMLIRPSPCLP